MVHTREVMLKMRPLVLIIIAVVIVSHSANDQICFLVPHWGR